MPQHTERLKGVSLLKHAAVYGANASGKSNLIDCVRFVQQALLHGLTLESTKWYCRASAQNENKESTFDVLFSVGEEFYAYGFSAILSQRRVVEEWLYALNDGAPTSLFERDVNEESITTSMTLEAEESARFRTYAQDFSQSGSMLFLAELNRSKRFDKDSKLMVFKTVFDWLLSCVNVIGPMEHYGLGRYSDYFLNDESRGYIEDILASFDTGVSHIALRKLSNDELVDMVSAPVLKRLLEDIEEQFERRDVERVGGTVRREQSLVFIEFERDGNWQAQAMQLKHAGSESLFDFDEESDGTRRLFDLVCILLTARDDVVFVVDELERSLHPMLVRQLIEKFMQICGDMRTQLIFSTHESSLMSLKLFRKDEIWFVDRGRSGNSRLYSLDRFTERFDEDVAIAYLDGRYGATPVFKELVFGEGGDQDASGL